MSISKFKILSLLLVLSVLSCTKENSSLIEFENTGQDVEISLDQNVGSLLGPYYELIISVTDSVDCKNAYLEANSFIKNKKLVVNLDGISQANCLLGKSKPEYINPLFEALGELPLELNIKNSILAKGSINFNELRAQLQLENNSAVTIKVGQIQKLESSTVWGRISAKDAGQLAEMNDILVQYKNPNFIPASGDYGLFTYNNGFIQFDHGFELKGNFNKDIFIRYTNWEELKANIESYAQSHTDAHGTFQNAYGEIIEF